MTQSMTPGSVLDGFFGSYRELKERLAFKPREIFLLVGAAACATVVPLVSAFGALAAIRQAQMDCESVRNLMSQSPLGALAKNSQTHISKDSEDLFLGAGHPSVVLNRLAEFGILSSLGKGAVRMTVYASGPVVGALCGVTQPVGISPVPFYGTIGVLCVVASIALGLGARRVYKNTKRSLEQNPGHLAITA